ncbi:flavin reductase family protein [Pseudochelatococcus sp. B33]
MANAFRDAFRRHPAGVAIITADTENGPVALTVSSLISVSASPPVVAFSLSSSSRASVAIVKAGTMVIHFLRYADQDLARLCSASGADRFGPGIDWERLPTGEPRYRSVETWFRARLQSTTPVEGATLVTAILLEGNVASETESTGIDALVYLDRRWHCLG